MTDREPTMYEQLLAQSVDARAGKFAWLPEEKLYPDWMWVKCPGCDGDMVVGPDVEKRCVDCGLSEMIAQGAEERRL